MQHMPDASPGLEVNNQDDAATSSYHCRLNWPHVWRRCALRSEGWKSAPQERDDLCLRDVGDGGVGRGYRCSRASRAWRGNDQSPEVICDRRVADLLSCEYRTANGPTLGE